MTPLSQIAKTARAIAKPDGRDTPSDDRRQLRRLANLVAELADHIAKRDAIHHGMDGADNVDR